MDRVGLFGVSDRVPRLTMSGEDILRKKVDSISIRIITKVVGTRYTMWQECVFEV